MYKNILTIDTSTKYCFVILQNNGIIYKKIQFCPCLHMKYVLFLVNSILNETNILLSEINLLGYNLGPGNFTSVRIGIAVIESISYALNIPKIGLSHLMILAEKSWKIKKIKRIITIIKCNKEFVYFSLYRRTKKGLWIGKNNECLLNYNNIINKISLLKGKWGLISDINNFIKNNIKLTLNKNLKISFIKNKILFSEEIINIINNILLNKKKIKKNYVINYIKNTF
ncbi:tRNA (adenosine(37)-N6)-threonylcarbamoyltransferase complex dimerization subunit type 1 TsaB [Enterobacteriaceae endosymbiont of Donacia bicoloricornis]|uniref:tRNA (adenosine(37)-N6)-threonylcarbamoyltransferase complex dimerization subunit type 1 TsaB n=1 Tax=Enterobacteriaceae endosymbiont of Donacia bicoloricornis TaxID=2675772 RepID=UPI0014499338|nr:tRNA (adenosine(37)-N6)-threonylcarbamoyltransferase complex dimerization subunit type 1 TsaB [Enterobacteriaceae endosymbiont of Donacia bicoloricornis]QJC37652.1 tRNA (adenosine(37)-N6)-threonylcarbamoyltransferase complex dimerization subunit type 1 TsaB [Enterobacteriaceae endosymbiont of Donacia bicoloricornis]